MPADRGELARRALDGYVSGPDAPIHATARALAKAGGAATLVLVEGISDQIAVETAAAARGRDLDAERVVVVPIGGAHAIGRFLATSGPAGDGRARGRQPGAAGDGWARRRQPGPSGDGRVRLAGLCDLPEEHLFRRGLDAATGGGHLGVYVCVNDLEDELIRAVGTAGVEALFESQGDLASLRSLQRQPAWRGRDPDAQLRRFLGSGARRKLRYARLLVEAAAVRDVLPRPLDALVTAI